MVVTSLGYGVVALSMSSEEGNAVAKGRRALDALYRVSSLAGNSEDPEIALEGIIDEVMRTLNAGSA